MEACLPDQTERYLESLRRLEALDTKIEIRLLHTKSNKIGRTSLKRAPHPISQLPLPTAGPGQGVTHEIPPGTAVILSKTGTEITNVVVLLFSTSFV